LLADAAKEKNNGFKADISVHDTPALAPDTTAQPSDPRHCRGTTFATLAAALGLTTMSADSRSPGVTSIFVIARR
jgi:hypothetical protein